MKILYIAEKLDELLSVIVCHATETQQVEYKKVVDEVIKRLKNELQVAELKDRVYRDSLQLADLTNALAKTNDKLSRRNTLITDLRGQINKANSKGYRIVHYGEDYIAICKAKDAFKGKVHEITGNAIPVFKEILPVDIKY
ncbi:hypothetical protein LCGC14_1248720 [marine sediment metagenome]|uniref:Uncharacterized protein n=1 Tax=marine sediment metagenome TaxID=412755 RepID=A0A0F9L3N6_9ZZZZ